MDDSTEAEVNEVQLFRRIQVLCLEYGLQVGHHTQGNQILLTHQVQPIQGSNEAPAIMTLPQRPRPTQDQSRQAAEWVARAKHEFLVQSKISSHSILDFKVFNDIAAALPSMKSYQIPDTYVAGFIEIISHIYRVSAEFETKLAMFFYVVQDATFVRKVIAIVRIYLIYFFI